MPGATGGAAPPLTSVPCSHVWPPTHAVASEHHGRRTRLVLLPGDTATQQLRWPAHDHGHCRTASLRRVASRRRRPRRVATPTPDVRVRQSCFPRVVLVASRKPDVPCAAVMEALCYGRQRVLLRVCGRSRRTGSLSVHRGRPLGMHCGAGNCDGTLLARPRPWHGFAPTTRAGWASPTCDSVALALCRFTCIVPAVPYPTAPTAGRLCAISPSSRRLAAQQGCCATPSLTPARRLRWPSGVAALASARTRSAAEYSPLG